MRYLWLALVVLLPAAAIADPESGDDDASRHFQTGIDHFAAERYEDALREFRHAYQIAPHPSTLYNIAVTYKKAGSYAEAISSFDAFIREGTGRVLPERVTRAQEELNGLRASLGTVRITAAHEGWMVFANGREVGVTPLDKDVLLLPGSCEVEARGPGGELERRTVVLQAGERVTITMDGAGESVSGADPASGARASSSALVTARPAPSAGTFGVSLGLGTNVAMIRETGAPVVGLGARLGSRATVGLDLVLIAWAVAPTLRIRIADLAGPLSVHGLVSAPVSFESETEAKVAAGMGVRYAFGSRVSVRVEAWLSGTGSDLAVPVFGFVELRL